MIVAPQMPRNNALPLAARAAVARQMLRHCELCEWRCGVNRVIGERAPCRLGPDTYIFQQYMSLTEEPEVAPALRVYLGGCNFRCRFCDTAPECFEPTAGSRLEAPVFAEDLREAARRGARYVSVLGGEPTLHTHALLEVAAKSPLPLAVNTNLYMTPEVLELLDGVVALYLADMKFGNDECARRIAGVLNYVNVVQRNAKLIFGRTSLIIRHLLMPGHFECCFAPIVDWLEANLPGARFELYTGYVPCWKAATDPNLGRLNRADERQAAIERLRNSNLDWVAGDERR